MTRTWPLPRIAGGPRRASTFLLRQHAGIHRRRRVQIHARRDEALHRLARIDAQLDRLSAERVQLLEELEAVRDTLWPVNPHRKGRRPPALDRPPLPPAPLGAQPARAGDLRTLCLVLLGRHGPLALPDLHALLHRYGNVIIGDQPVKALADAMRYEVRKGRAVRVDRGVYDLDPGLRRRGLPTWPDPAGLGDPLRWAGPDAEGAAEADAAPPGDAEWSAVPADQQERTDPGRWGGDTWPTTPDPPAEEPVPGRSPRPDAGLPGTPPDPSVPLFEPYGNESAPIRSRTAEKADPEVRGGVEDGPADGTQGPAAGRFP